MLASHLQSAQARRRRMEVTKDRVYAETEVHPSTTCCKVQSPTGCPLLESIGSQIMSTANQSSNVGLGRVQVD